MKRYDLIVIGAGPAGLSAAIEAAENGLTVAVFDENEKPGGQLFKQIHKFFGSKEHRAKTRGLKIGYDLLEQAEKLGVEVNLNSVVIGIFDFLTISVKQNDMITHYSGDNIIVATGASENVIPFENWTLPGVVGAGAAQTMMNLYGIRPGSRVIMIGSGNVGLVVGFQLLQAGCDLVAVVDAAPRVGGYGVHAAKLTRIGIPFYTRHTIIKATGTDQVTGAVIAEVDENFCPIPGTEKHFDVDTICVAVGLSPMSQITRLAGCNMKEEGGLVPIVNEYYETSVPGVFTAGDVAGIEEASSAMITGRIAGAAASARLEFITEEQFRRKIKEYRSSLDKLRKGMFGADNRGKVYTRTDEGYRLSIGLLKNGYIDESELSEYPSIDTKARGVHPVVECVQNIPCNPCEDACNKGCITVGENITDIPVVNPGAKCSDCGMCAAVCPGQAIFLVNEDYEPGFAAITLPYEFLPAILEGEKGVALDRSGKVVCDAEVVRVRNSKAYDKTTLLTIKVPVEYAGKARFFRSEVYI